MSFEPIGLEPMERLDAQLSQASLPTSGVATGRIRPKGGSNQIWYIKTRFSFGCRKTLLPSFRPSSLKR